MKLATFLQKFLRIFVPVLILAGAVGIGYALIKLKSEPETKETPTPAISVSVMEPVRKDIRAMVESQGTVEARTRTSLVAEVGGPVIEIGENFRPGAFFRKGDLLLRIDPFEYEVAVESAEADVARAEAVLETEAAQAEQAEEDWKLLGEGEANPLVLRRPQLKEARASVDSAEAALRRAKDDLDKTKIRAPYDGRVVSQDVDIGTFVSAGPTSPLGEIYAIDVAEVRLPLNINDLGDVNIPQEFGNRPDADRPLVTLSTSIGGKSFTWKGEVIRSEARFDDRSRLLSVIVAVEDPYAQDPEQPRRPPLKPGMFVGAEIEGRTLENVLEVPRAALREGNTLLVADAESRLRRREVKVLRATARQALVGEGLEPGDRIIISPVEYVVDGAPLRIDGEDETTVDAPGAPSDDEKGTRS